MKGPICTTTIAISKETRRVIKLLAVRSNMSMQKYLCLLLVPEAEKYGIEYDPEYVDDGTYDEQVVLNKRRRMRLRLEKLGKENKLQPIAVDRIESFSE